MDKDTNVNGCPNMHCGSQDTYLNKENDLFHCNNCGYEEFYSKQHPENKWLDSKRWR